MKVTLSEAARTFAKLPDASAPPIFGVGENWTLEEARRQLSLYQLSPQNDLLVASCIFVWTLETLHDDLAAYRDILDLCTQKIGNVMIHLGSTEAVTPYVRAKLKRSGRLDVKIRKHHPPTAPASIRVTII